MTKFRNDYFAQQMDIIEFFIHEMRSELQAERNSINELRSELQAERSSINELRLKLHAEHRDA